MTFLFSPVARWLKRIRVFKKVKNNASFCTVFLHLFVFHFSFFPWLEEKYDHNGPNLMEVFNNKEIVLEKQKLVCIFFFPFSAYLVLYPKYIEGKPF